MAHETFMNKLRSFFGLHHQQPPKNDFRNPIWGSDDDDDGDELYSRQHIDVHSQDLHQEISRHMYDMVRSFGGMFLDMKSFFNDDIKSFFDHDQHFDYEYTGSLPEQLGDSDKINSNSIRDYYLKPGYHNRKSIEHKDIDLDGKLSSQEISGLLKNHGEENDDTPATVMPFDGTRVPGRSFCKTIITTSVKKPDGTVETRRIVKSGSDIIEDTITSSGPETPGPHIPAPGVSTISSTGILLSELTSIFKNFY